ncbi:unnamed protein product [Musa acuminata var. zebrina]
MATRGTAERVRSTRLRQARRRPAGIASRGSSPTPPCSIAVAASVLLLNEPAKPPSFPACRLFGRNCPCYGRKSVDVDETCSEPKSSIRSGSDLNASSTAKNRCFRTGEMGLNSFPDRVMPEETKNDSLFGYSHVFSCPVLNPSSLNNLAEEPPRESLEVFRPTRHTAAALSTPPDSQLAAVVFPFSDQVNRRSFTRIPRQTTTWRATQAQTFSRSKASPPRRPTADPTPSTPATISVGALRRRYCHRPMRPARRASSGASPPLLPGGARALRRHGREAEMPRSSELPKRQGGQRRPNPAAINISGRIECGAQTQTRFERPKPVGGGLEVQSDVCCHDFYLDSLINNNLMLKIIGFSH